jgi:hypothetical protein
MLLQEISQILTAVGNISASQEEKILTEIRNISALLGSDRREKIPCETSKRRPRGDKKIHGNI